MPLYEVPVFREEPVGLSTELLVTQAYDQDKPIDEIIVDLLGSQALVYRAPYAFCLSEPHTDIGDRITGDDVRGVARYAGALTLKTIFSAQVASHKFGVVEDSAEPVLVMRNLEGIDSSKVGIRPACDLPTVSSTSPYVGLPIRDDVFLAVGEFYKLSEVPEQPPLPPLRAV